MALGRKQITFVNKYDISGLNVAADRNVTVTLKGGGSATVYSDAAGSSPITNPVTDSNGVFDFFAKPGFYTVSAGTLSEDVEVEDPTIIEIATTTELINLEIADVTNKVIRTLGYTTAGDGGGAEWYHTGVTGLTPSQSPLQRNDIKLNDASGNEWQLSYNKIINLLALGGTSSTYEDIANAAGVKFLQNISANVVKDPQTLTSGQTVVTSSTVDLTTANVHVNHPSIDSRQLTDGGVDYTVDSSTQITLTNSFPNGTDILLEGRPLTGGISLPAVSGNVNKYLGTDGSRYKFKPFPYEPSRVEIIAHRGYRDIGFQNTLLSLSQSRKLGADSLECDLSISSDGVWYLFHDATVDALTDGTGTFTALTSTYLDGLKYTKANGTPYDGIQISRLDDVLTFIKQERITLYPEVKNRGADSDVTDLYNTLAAADVLDLVRIQSFQTADLDILRALDADLPLCYTTSETNVNTILSTIDGKDYTELAIDKAALIADPTMASTLKAQGYGVIAWTIDNKQDAVNVLEVGVDRIMVDRNI